MYISNTVEKSLYIIFLLKLLVYDAGQANVTADLITSRLRKECVTESRVTGDC
jgi:hypothetical protein